jgi:hypothetical protein
VGEQILGHYCADHSAIQNVINPCAPFPDCTVSCTGGANIDDDPLFVDADVFRTAWTAAPIALRPTHRSGMRV